MATRFRFLDSGLDIQPPRDLLEQLFAPGTVYAGVKKGDEGSPAYVSALDLLQRGNPDLGLKPFESLFDESGRVLDPDALLRDLQVGSVLSAGPTTIEEALSRGLYSQGNDGALLNASTIGSPLSFGNPSRGAVYNNNDPGKFYDQILPQGLPASLDEFLRGLNDFNSRINDPRERFFDPSRVRFADYRLGDLDIRNATKDQLDEEARRLYGVDFLTLAASPDELLKTRQRYLNNPDAIIDPATGALRVSGIRGLNPLDSAARISEFNQALERILAGDQGLIGQGLKRRSTALGTTDVGRSAFGQFLLSSLGDQAPVLGRTASPLQGPDSSFLFQSALTPDLIDQTLAQLRFRF